MTGYANEKGSSQEEYISSFTSYLFDCSSVRVLLRFRLIVLELMILGRHEKVNYECLLQRTVINGSSFSSGYQVVDESTGKFELAALLDALKD